MPKIQKELKKIEDLESDLLAKEGEVLRAEERILASEKEVAKEIAWLKRAESHRHQIVQRLSKHKFLFSTLVTFGVVLIWRGLWNLTDMLPVIKDTGVSLLLGFGIIWFLEKYSDG
jgi:hypothetical protein